MTLLNVSGLTKYFGAEKLFGDISFTLAQGEKMGLVGKNGAGKSTLLKMLAGKEEVDGGAIAIVGNSRLGFLTQDPVLEQGLTVEEETLKAFGHLKLWEERLRALEGSMALASGDGLEQLMEEYGQLTVRFEAAGGYEYHARCRAVLFGLGFTQDDLRLQVEHLSGGQRVRAGLAKLLLEQPDLLLLDEPTNHLDLGATEWLEEHLKGFKGAVIAVSHDRYFLDAVTAKTLEIDGGRGTVYSGNYSYFVRVREERLTQQHEQYQRQQAEISRMKAFIQKWRAGTRSRQSKSWEKRLDRLDVIDKPRLRQKEMGLEFPINAESGEEVLHIDRLGKSYDANVLFRGLTAVVERGERIALVGKNGAGKTTLLKILTGRERPTEGSFSWGFGVEWAYFSQDLNQVDDRNTLLREIQDSTGMTNFEARSLLGRFLFSGEDAEKVVGSLSGGERNRLVLAKLVTSEANVLLLDEPTNHLDLASKRVLEEALVEFPGTIFVVSHDRYFLDCVATRVFEFIDGGINQYEGNYTAFREARLAAAAALAAGARGQGCEPKKDERPKGGREQEATREAQRQARAALKETKRLEEEISSLEQRKADLEGRLSNPEAYREARARELTLEYQVVCRDLERLYVQWEKIAGGQ